MKTKKILVSLGIILIGIGLVLSAVCILKNTYFGFKARAARGIESCQKFSGKVFSDGLDNNQATFTIEHPYCKINIWGEAELIKKSVLSYGLYQSGDLIVRIINLNNYFGEGGKLIMKLDQEVVTNPQIISAIVNTPDINTESSFIELTKPTGLISICGDINLSNRSTNNLLITPSEAMEYSFGKNKVFFCSKLFASNQMPFMGIAFVQPSQESMAMKLYIPPEEANGEKVSVDDFILYHNSFLPFDKANLIIN